MGYGLHTGGKGCEGRERGMHAMHNPQTAVLLITPCNLQVPSTCDQYIPSWGPDAEPESVLRCAGFLCLASSCPQLCRAAWWPCGWQCRLVDVWLGGWLSVGWVLAS